MPKCSTTSGAYNASDPGYFDDVPEAAPEEAPAESTESAETTESADDTETQDVTTEPVVESATDPAAPTLFEPQHVTLPKFE